MIKQLRILVVTSEWPTPERPNRAPMVVRQVNYLRQEGLDVDVFRFRGGRKVRNYVSDWLGLRRNLARKKYDLIHAHWGHAALLALPKSLPLVVTFHGSDLEGIIGLDGRCTLAGRLLRSISIGVSRLADQVIFVSESLTRFTRPREHNIIPIGADLELFQPRPQQEARRQLGLPAHGKLALFAADPDRMVKQYPLAKAAVDLLKGQFDCRLVATKGIPYERMPLYMNACDVLVLTSLHEGSPSVVLEALACNLPVVSVDVGDVRSRIGSVEGCVVCDDCRPETIAAALAQALSRANRVKGREAVRHLGHRFLAKRIISVYERVLWSGNLGAPKPVSEVATVIPRPMQNLLSQDPAAVPSQQGEIRIVSVIIPCRNEAGGIESFLNSVLGQTLPAGCRMEVLIADGMSDDGTRQVLARFEKNHANIRLLDNPEKIVSTGLNAAIRQARGEIIIRMDSHTQYAPDYVARCLEVLEETGADNVGGPARTRPQGYVASAVSAAYHSRFSNGGATFHREDYEGYTDTVPYGCWKAATLQRLGMFDEDLVRNQDDELNLRLVRAGGKIWQSPKIVSWYHTRSTLSSLFRQYFQYGFWKIPVIRKHRLPASWRHLVPGSFVLVISLLLLVSILSWAFGSSRMTVLSAGALAILTGTYGMGCVLASVVAARNRGWSLLPVLPLVFATYHVSYGLGFLLGIWHWNLRSSLAGPAPKAFTKLSR